MDKHITEKLSAFLNHELPPAERQAVAEHLLNCQTCRNEHDAIKLGAAFASQLKRADAPRNLWNEIENALDEKRQVSLVPNFSFFNSRGLLATAAALLIGFGLLTAAYFVLSKNKSQEVAKIEMPSNNANLETPPTRQTPNEVLANQNSNTQTSLNVNSNVQIQQPNKNPSVRSSPETKPIEPKILPSNNLPAWNVETLAGTPKAGSQTILQKGKLAVGEFLETDASSRAKIQVANIGKVEIAPNSRVQLVKTQAKEHRLSLERGAMHAKILAPPRLFIVDTPSAVAVDLGCEYTLEVDPAGNSKLHVTAGFVALERDGRESIVPAGAICFTQRGKGLGTPFSADAAAEFQKAVHQFDFENGGSRALQTIIKEADFYDALTLWHLLSRAPERERAKVFDALANYVKPPPSVTREGALRLNKKMLKLWWTEIENLWFE